MQRTPVVAPSRPSAARSAPAAPTTTAPRRSRFSTRGLLGASRTKTERKYLDEDLYQALRYTEQDEKTDEKKYVSGVNCSAAFAYQEMVAVKQDYGADEIMVGAKVASGEAKNGRLSGGIAKVSPSQAVKVAESQDSEVHLSSNEVIAPHVAEVPSVEVVRARAIWEEVVKDVGKSATALFERLDALVDPARVEDANMLAAWREKYANEITERTKKMWWLRRLWRKVG